MKWLIKILEKLPWEKIVALGLSLLSKKFPEHTVAHQVLDVLGSDLKEKKIDNNYKLPEGLRK